MSYLSQIKSGPFNLILGDQAKTWTEEAADKLAQIERAGGLGKARASGLLDLLSASSPTAEQIGPVGVVHIKGPIGKGLSKVDLILGATDLNTVEADLERFAADPSVKSILLDINSPGGTVAGVPEVAALVRQINETKKVVAFGNAASAAYWIGSQASEYLTTASAPAIGSVGVFVPHLDRTGELKAKGISVEVIKSGKYKGQIPGLPLSEEARAAIQAEVIDLHNEFKADVLAVRSRINPDDLEGQTFTGKRAAARGFVTGLVRNRAEVLARLGAFEPKSGKPGVKASGSAQASAAPLAAAAPTSVEVPDYAMEAASRGLEWHSEGKSGDGVTDQTIAEAREIAAGRISVDKLRRMSPWFNRHLPDLDAPANKPDDENFPGAGAVAWALWGGPTSGELMRTAQWAETKVQIIDAETEEQEAEDEAEDDSEDKSEGETE
jgi:ClpP class serine protease